MAKEIANPLNVIERKDLRNAEKVIDRGVATFLEVGNALKVIQDGNLYRETHKSFGAFVEAKWDLGKSHAYRLIDAATVRENLSPMGDTLPDKVTERVLRPLAKLPDDQQANAFQDVVEETGGNPTAADVAAKVDTYLAGDEPYAESDEPEGDDAPEPPEPVLDALKRPVEEHLEAIFSQRAEYLAIRKDYTALEKRAEALAEDSAGVYLEFETLRRDSRNLKNAIKFGTPYAPCPYCGGRKGGCKALAGHESACRKTGFVNEAIWKNAPPEGK